MNPIEHYLIKQNRLPFISTPPDHNLRGIVVIPCYDEPDLSTCLASIEKAAKNITEKIEVIIVINDGELDGERVKVQNANMISWLANQSFSVPVYTIYLSEVSSKKAGVGYARKMGMDEACNRFQYIAFDQGIIFSMDADTTVDPDYFKAIWSDFESSRKSCMVIYYEHDVDHLADPLHSLAIIRYELHLRYYILALRRAGFPHAYQTLGSAFAVKASSYAAMGGMKPNKAGEDFYFIQKFAIKDEVYEVRSTIVHPSSRMSHRVPFGTGKAILDAMKNKTEYGTTYPWQAFLDLREMLSKLKAIYTSGTWKHLNLSDSINSYLIFSHFEETLAELIENTTSYSSFCKRFFQKMNAFELMKYIHFCVKEMNMGMEEIKSACLKLSEDMHLSVNVGYTEREWLQRFRAIDRAAPDDAFM